MNFSTGYDGLGDLRSAKVSVDFKDAVSRTVQSQRDEADINVIVRRFGVTGMVPQSVRLPTYGDFTGVEDYRTGLHALKEAQASFMAMPSHVRKRFDNDPAKFVDFCSDKANLPELRKMGLAVPEPELERSIVERRMKLEREIAAELDLLKPKA